MFFTGDRLASLSVSQYVCCVVDGYCCCVVLDIVSFFSAGLWYVLYAYFILLSSRLSVTHTICLHFYFLVSRPSVRRTIFSFYFILIICSRAKCYRASTV